MPRRLFLSPRRRGRPVKREPGSRISAWVSSAKHDRLIAAARRRGQSVSALLRDILERYDFSS